MSLRAGWRAARTEARSRSPGARSVARAGLLTSAVLALSILALGALGGAGSPGDGD